MEDITDVNEFTGRSIVEIGISCGANSGISLTTSLVVENLADDVTQRIKIRKIVEALIAAMPMEAIRELEAQSQAVRDVLVAKDGEVSLVPHGTIKIVQAQEDLKRRLTQGSKKDGTEPDGPSAGNA